MKNTIDYDLPYKWNYYKEGSNSSAVAFRDENSGFTYFYSYNTLVAFEHTLSGLVVRENVWGATTGKHLNAIDGKAFIENIIPPFKVQLRPSPARP